MFIRQHDGPVQLIRKTTVTPSNHHDANHNLAKSVELAAEGHVDGGVAETQPDIGAKQRCQYSHSSWVLDIERGDILCGSDLEEDGKEIESLQDQ